MEKTPARSPIGDVVKVPPFYWDELKEKNLEDICKNALARLHPPEGLVIYFLHEDVLVDIENCCLRRLRQKQWEKIDDSFLELMILVYLLNVTSHPLENEMISVKDLKDSQFFQGPHELKVAPLLKVYGNDLDGFIKAAEKLGGKPFDQADAAYTLYPLPKIPLYYILWKGDEEFGPHLSILFDRSIEYHLAADAIWGLVNYVSGTLLRAHK